MNDDLNIILRSNNKFELEFINNCPLLDKLGYSHKDLVNSNFFNLIHPSDQEKAAIIIKKNKQQNSPFNELRLKTVNGYYLWVKIKAKKIKTNNNKLRIFLTLRDISELKKLEEELRIGDERFKKITESIPEIRFWKLFNPKKYEEALQTSFEMLQTVMENIPQYVYWKDKDLNYLGCNKNYANLINLDYPENIINNEDLDLPWNGNCIKFNLSKEKNIIRSKKAVLHNIESWDLKNGKKITVKISRVPLFDLEKNVSGILISFEDVTEKITAEQKLKSSEEKYRNILETIKEGYFETDLNGNFTFFNDAVCELTGYSRKELTNINYKALIGNDIEKKFFDVYNNLYQLGKGYKILDFELKKKNGEIIYLESSVYLIYNDKNEITSFKGIVRDITERKKIEILRKEFNSKLEKEVSLRTEELKVALDQHKLYLDQILKASHFKSEFLSTMSHELRTPLNVIIGFTDLLLEEVYGTLNEEQQNFIKDIDQSARHLLDMITCILDISKIESGHISINTEKIELTSLVENIVSTFLPTISNKNLKIELRGFKKPLFILADRIKLKQVLYNLLSNAIKFTKEGLITIEFCDNEKYWRFNVKDTGIGIAECDFDIIFKDFKRVNSDFVKSLPGNGLGLALTKRIVNLHGGNISFISQLGKGTTFTFTIPKDIKYHLNG